MNKKIASEIAVGIVLLLAIIIGGIFWMQNNKIQNLEKKQSPMSEGSVDKAVAMNNQKPSQSVLRESPIAESQIPTPETTTEIPPSKESSVQVPIQQVDSRVAIHFSIENKNGKRLKNVLCEVTTNNKNNSKMIVKAAKKTDTNGNCFFEKLDSIDPYLVRVYWTDDKSRNSMISLSFIPAGATITRTIAKPQDMF